MLQAIVSAEKKDESAKDEADVQEPSTDSTKTLNDKRLNTAMLIAKPKANQALYDNAKCK